MIRNRRGDTGIDWPKRIVTSIPVDLSESEQELYDAICALKTSQNLAINSVFSIITLQPGM